MRKVTCVSIDEDMYHKIHVIHTIRKHFFDDNTSTISSIFEQALKEYFVNHDDEITELMKKYHEEGGYFEI